jgi:hypothetical protein
MNVLPDLIAGGFHLLIMPRTFSAQVIDLVSRLALRGPVQVLDGGNCFNAYRCSRAIARQLYRMRGGGEAGLEAALGRIRVARAFTCYQMLALLADTPASPFPTVALDLLATFYDENVPVPESQRLVEASAAHLKRLGRLAPVLASASPAPPVAAGRSVFIDILEQAAVQVWMVETPTPPPPPQLELPF